MKKKGDSFIFLLVLLIIEMFLFKISSMSEGLIKMIFNGILVTFNCIVAGVVLLKNNNDEKKFYYLIFFSFVIRTIFVYLDLKGYTSGFTGADTERFFRYASNNVPSTVNYIKFLTAFFNFFGVSRFIAQYFNVLVYLLSIYYFYKILNLLEVDYKRKFFSLLIFAFAPANILLSVALLREPLMIFLNILALYHFILWYKDGKTFNFLFSIICIAFSSWFHSGMIGAIILYLIAFPFYKRDINKIVIKKNSIFLIILFVAILISLYSAFGSSVLSYFDRINGIEDITARNSVGNTDYLNFLNNTNSLPVLLLFIPLKIVYFYFSPMPWDCHTLNVLLVFIFSSSIYIYLFCSALRNISENKTLKLMIMILLISLSTVYALGVSNAGTAMRHREKILPYVLILYAISGIPNKERGKKYENNV